MNVWLACGVVAGTGLALFFLEKHIIRLLDWYQTRNAMKDVDWEYRVLCGAPVHE